MSYEHLRLKGLNGSKGPKATLFKIFMDPQGKRQLIQQLVEVGAVKHGTFTLKSGQVTNTYIDLRLSHYPALTCRLAQALLAVMRARDPYLRGTGFFEAVCGVPYSGLVYASHISQIDTLPLIVVRKEPKDHGTMEQVNGLQWVCDQGEYGEPVGVTVIEDVVTTGQSVLDTIATLQRASPINHVLAKVICIVDRRSPEDVAKWPKDIELISVFKFSDFHDSKTMTFADRVLGAPSDSGIKRLIDVMIKKRSNLCVSLDLVNVDDVKHMFGQIAPHVCMVKFHFDLIHPSLVGQIADAIDLVAEQHDVFIFSDDKFGDIGSIVKAKVGGSDGIDISNVVTAHAIAGQSCIDGILSAAPNIGILLVAEMSCQGSFRSEEYVTHCMELASKNPSVIGFVAQGSLDGQLPHQLIVTPGVSFDTSPDSLGQCYRTPEEVIEAGADVIIVGRAIYQATDPLAETIKYKEAAWAALEKRWVH